MRLLPKAGAPALAKSGWCRKRIGGAFVLAIVPMVVTGCATAYEGTYHFSEGWREAIVVEIAEASNISKSGAMDCRKRLGAEGARHKFARVYYSFSAARRIHAVVPVEDPDRVAVGDKVYINIRECHAAVLPRNHRPQP